jgi:uncharacterized protein
VHLGWSTQARAGRRPDPQDVAWTWKVKLSLSLERDLFTRLREEAEAVAIKVFADNLRDLLLAAPAGPRVVMGLDPGIRTGVKVAVVDATGKVLDHRHRLPARAAPRLGRRAAHAGRLVAKHGVDLIAIGNGTASRETDKLAADLIKLLPDLRRELQRQGGGQRGRRLGLFGERVRERRNCPSSTSACAAPSASRAACRTRWPNW